MNWKNLIKKHGISEGGMTPSVAVAKQLIINVRDNIAVNPCIVDMTKKQAYSVLCASVLYSQGWGLPAWAVRDLVKYITAWKLGQTL